ncbi:MAG: hypothetical protein IPJ25_08460 [Rhodocyclaceae bacterium]|nr:hypothetical protein [Rhodocyclaceae bacterium]
MPLVRVPILNDSGYEAAGETFTLTATNPVSTTTTNTTATGSATIISEDVRPFMYIVDAPPVVEGSTITFTVGLSAAAPASGINATVTYSNTAPTGLTGATGGASGSGGNTDYYNNGPARRSPQSPVARRLVPSRSALAVVELIPTQRPCAQPLRWMQPIPCSRT